MVWLPACIYGEWHGCGGFTAVVVGEVVHNMLPIGVMKMNWISNSVGPTVKQFASVTRLDLSSALGRLEKQSRGTRIAIFVLLFGLTVWLDLVVDHNLSLFPIYLIPTLYSAWYLGSRWAYTSCLAGGMVWFVDDRPGWYSYHYTLIPYGNLAGRLLVLAVIVAIVNSLKDAFEDQYEAERRVVRKELEVASEVQRRLLPSRPPDYPGLDLGFVYRPARQLSGDYYDFIPLGSHSIAIAIGDVSGKGLPSALLMASLQSLVRTNLAMREGKLSRFAAELSEWLYEQTAAERYATLFLAVVDTRSMLLNYVNAGHNPPLFFRKWTLSKRQSPSNILDKGGPPLGMFRRSQYQCGQILLHEGDVLVFYTDGITDAANREVAQFGEERLRASVEQSLSLSAPEICQRIREHLQTFTGATPQWDDITLAVMKVKPKLSESATGEPAVSESSDLPSAQGLAFESLCRARGQKETNIWQSGGLWNKQL
jgi:serine phosphatase RsbU (regulator of sigma subunit)